MPAATPDSGLRLIGLVPLALALQLAITAYDGWQSGGYFAGEDVEPGRNLPRAMIGGVAIVVLVYVLLNAAVQHVLPAAVSPDRRCRSPKRRRSCSVPAARPP